MSNSVPDAIAMIRQRPGMYIGDTGRRGVEHLINELVANGLDLYLADAATQVSVTHEGGEITVADDGPGLPFDQIAESGQKLAETYFTQLHLTPTADGHSPHVHLNPCGLGLIVVSALSSSLKVISHRAGFRWEQHFERGRIVSTPEKSKSQGSGTSITFVPDADIFGSIAPRWASIRRKLFETAHLFPGVVLRFQSEAFHAPQGLPALAEFMAPPEDGLQAYPNEKLLEVNTEIEGIQVNAAAFGSAKTCAWTSWCNGIQTCRHGSHVQGFKDALREAGWTPAVGLIHVLLKRPEFNSPTRAQLSVKHVRAVVRRAVRERLVQRDPTRQQ